MNTVSMSRENFAEVYGDAAPLLEKHWREIAHYSDIPLDPDVSRYIHVEAEGNLRIYTARLIERGAQDNKLVGYAVFFLGRNAHYRSSLQAVQDILYVDPEHRNSTIGLRLLKFCETALKVEGVQAVYHHVKVAHPKLGKILDHMGYEPVDVIYSKRLDKEQ